MFLFCGKLLENIKTSFCRRYRLISARFRQTQRRPLGLYRFYKFLCIFCGWMEKKMKMNSVSRILRDTYHLTPCTRERMFLLWRFRLVFRQFSVIRQRNEMMKKCYVLRRACASDHRFIWNFSENSNGKHWRESKENSLVHIKVFRRWITPQIKLYQKIICRRFWRKQRFGIFNISNFHIIFTSRPTNMVQCCLLNFNNFFFASQ